MRDIRFLLLTLLLISVILPQSTIPLVANGYGVVTGFYLLLLVQILITDDRPEIVAPRLVFVFVVVLVVTFFVQLAASPTLAELVRTPIFLITGINLFYLPRLIRIQYYYASVARISAVIIIIGLIPLFGGPQTIAGVDLTPWHGDFIFAGVKVRPPTSVFSNPNAFGFLALFGVLSAVAETIRHPNFISRSVIAINTLGLALSYYRTAWLALLAAIALYTSWRVDGRRGMVFVSALGAIVSIVGAALVFNLIPGPAAISSLDLNGRVQIWAASLKALWERPLFGFGFSAAHSAIQPYLVGTPQSGRGFHNSYLRMFVVSGIFGGVAYLCLTAATVLYPLRRVSTTDSAILVIFVVAGAIVQVFNGLTIFGLSMPSMFLSILTGFALQEAIGKRTLAAEKLVTE